MRIADEHDDPVLAGVANTEFDFGLVCFGGVGPAQLRHGCHPAGALRHLHQQAVGVANRVRLPVTLVELQQQKTNQTFLPPNEKTTTKKRYVCKTVTKKMNK